MENVNYQVDGKVLVKDFSAQIQRGDKIALIGPTAAENHVAEADARPAAGRQRADPCWHQLEVAYFDQHRASWIRIKR